MTITDELAAALAAQHEAESLCREWEREALHSLAGLVATPAEGYGAPGTGPGQFKADARRLRVMVSELQEDNYRKSRCIIAAAERIHAQSALLTQRAEKEVATTEGAPLARPGFDQFGNPLHSS